MSGSRKRPERITKQTVGDWGGDRLVTGGHHLTRIWADSLQDVKERVITREMKRMWTEEGEGLCRLEKTTSGMLANNSDHKPIPESISCLYPTVGQKTICFEMIQKFTAEVPPGQIASAGVRNSTCHSKPHLTPCGVTHLNCCLPFLGFPILYTEQQNLNAKSDPLVFRRRFLLMLVFHTTVWQAVWQAVLVRL